MCTIRARVVVFSRDELKQYEARAAVRRTTRGCAGSSATSATATGSCGRMHGVDYVVHAAALKQVDTAEYNPFEFVKTNIVGLAERDRLRDRQRRVRRSSRCRPTRRPARSTCTARPSSSATSCSSSANHYAAQLPDPLRGGPLRQRDGQPRLGHPVLPQARRRGPVAADHRQADDAVLDQPGRRRCKFVVDSFEMMQGGELYVPRIPSMRIMDLAEADRAELADARDRHPPRREAARGDDLAGGGSPRPAHRRPVRAAADHRDLGLPAAGARRCRCRTDSRTGRTPTTCG